MGFLLLCLLLLGLAGVHAQAPYAVQIAGSPVGSGDDLVKATAVDLVGNTYVVGDFRSPALIIAGNKYMNAGANATTTTGVTSDIFVAKFNWKGELDWALKWGGPLDELAADVVVENKNIYVVGSFKSSVFTISSTASLSNPSRAGGAKVEVPYVTFMVKLDTTGKVLWTSDLGDGQATALAVDPAQGLVYAAGAYHTDGSMADDDDTYDDDDLPSKVGGGVLSFLGSAGTSATKAADDDRDDDADDDVRNPGFLDAYVTCLSSTSGVSYGSVLISGEKNDYPTDLATDPSRKFLIMAGVFESPTINIGDMGTLKLDSSGGPAGWIVKLDSASGDILWSKALGKITSMLLRVAVDTTAIYVTGQFNAPAITSLSSGQSPTLIRMELSTGRVTWAKVLPKATHVALDFLGYAYLGGTYTNAVVLATNVTLPVATATAGDLYMAKVLTKTGQVVLARTFPSAKTGTYGVSDMSVDNAQNVYMAGTYHSATLNMSKTLNSPGSRVDGFLGRVLVQGTFPTAITTAQSTLAPTSPRPTNAPSRGPSRAPSQLLTQASSLPVTSNPTTLLSTQPPSPQPTSSSEAEPVVVQTLATQEETKAVANSPPPPSTESASTPPPIKSPSPEPTRAPSPMPSTEAPSPQPTSPPSPAPTPAPTPLPTPLPTNTPPGNETPAPEVVDDGVVVAQSLPQAPSEQPSFELLSEGGDDSTLETITEDTEFLPSYYDPKIVDDYSNLALEEKEALGIIEGDWTPPPMQPVKVTEAPLDKTILKDIPKAKTGIRLLVTYAGKPSTVKLFQTSLFNVVKPYSFSMVAYPARKSSSSGLGSMRHQRRALAGSKSSQCSSNDVELPFYIQATNETSTMSMLSFFSALGSGDALLITRGKRFDSSILCQVSAKEVVAEEAPQEAQNEGLYFATAVEGEGFSKGNLADLTPTKRPTAAPIQGATSFGGLVLPPGVKLPTDAEVLVPSAGADPPGSEEGKSKPNIAIIGGGAGGAFLFLALGAFVFMKKRKAAEMATAEKEEGMEEDEEQHVEEARAPTKPHHHMQAPAIQSPVRVSSPVRIVSQMTSPEPKSKGAHRSPPHRPVPSMPEYSPPSVVSPVISPSLASAGSRAASPQTGAAAPAGRNNTAVRIMGLPLPQQPQQPQQQQVPHEERKQSPVKPPHYVPTAIIGAGGVLPEASSILSTHPLSPPPSAEAATPAKTPVKTPVKVVPVVALTLPQSPPKSEQKPAAVVAEQKSPQQQALATLSAPAPSIPAPVAPLSPAKKKKEEEEEQKEKEKVKEEEKKREAAKKDQEAKAEAAKKEQEAKAEAAKKEQEAKAAALAAMPPAPSPIVAPAPTSAPAPAPVEEVKPKKKLFTFPPKSPGTLAAEEEKKLAAEAKKIIPHKLPPLIWPPPKHMDEEESNELPVVGGVAARVAAFEKKEEAARAASPPLPRAGGAPFRLPVPSTAGVSKAPSPVPSSKPAASERDMFALPARGGTSPLPMSGGAGGVCSSKEKEEKGKKKGDIKDVLGSL